ncbi:MAG: zinc-binding dehydrogenase [Nitrososphaeria archaeon]|nr:zinc-binding dehydrogenase [Nitrososphaeria archaeon]
MVKSRVACFDGPGKVSLKEIDLEPSEEQILVKTVQASICGTDKLYYAGEVPKEVSPPICPWGHEGGGIVVKVGSKVKEFSEGDLVMSFGPGTFSDYFLAKVPFGCIKAPEGIDLEIACLGEPLACAVHAARIATRNISVGDTAAVIGAGFAGQIILQGLRKGGADSLFVVDKIDLKLDFARKFGANITLNVEHDNVVKEVLDATDGRGVDLVVEASGSGEGLNLASEIVRHNGTIVIYSHYMKPFLANLYRWHEDALNIVHACLMHHTKEEMVVWTREAFRLVKKNIFNVKQLITRKYSLSEISEAFENEVLNRNSIKTAIIP